MTVERCPKCNTWRVVGKGCGRCLQRWTDTAPMSDAEARKAFRTGQRLETEALAGHVQRNNNTTWGAIGLRYTVRQVRAMTPDEFRMVAKEAHARLYPDPYSLTVGNVMAGR